MPTLPVRDTALQFMSRLALRCRWLHAPAGLLIVLLQRTPVLRVAAQVEFAVGNPGGEGLKYLFGLAALGAYNSLAGATTFSVSTATPASGAAGATFTIPGTTGTAMSIAFTVTGAPGNPKSWSVTGTLPAGLSVTGGNPVNVTAPYKMTIAGTPTAAGSSAVTVTAWDTNGAKGNHATINCTFNITGGVVTVAPSFSVQPAGATVTAGAAVTFAATAGGAPPPTYQWLKDGTAIAGATSASYSIASAAAADAGNYTVVATNSAGSATSTAAALTVNPAATAPSITAQPQPVTITAGSSASFSVTATGTATLAYQWQKGGVNIAGATAATYSIASAQATDAGNYTVVVTNGAGSVTSGAATLTVNVPAVAPGISAQPQNVTVSAGSGASFSVTATGTAPLTYQWKKGTANISGATAATYSIASAQSTDAGSYTVVVTNSVGSVTSTAATLTLSVTAVAPAVSAQPQSVTVPAGSSASFSVTANGTGPLTYQWQKGGANIAGATAATYSIASAQSGDAGNYTVVVTNSVGLATSAAATLTVSAAASAPSISTQPQPVTVTVGASASFSVTASGTAPLTYQWQKGGAAIAGGTAATYSIASAQATDAGNYSVVVSNGSGSVTSAAVALTVNALGSNTPAPVISANPLSQSVATGRGVSFSVTAAGTNTYQWQVSTDGGVTWGALADSSIYSGSTTSRLTITNAGSAMNGYLYRATVTNAGGSTSSGSVTLTVAAAVLPGPASVLAGSSGSLLVSDSNTNLVVTVTSAGQAATLAGVSGQQGATDGTGSGALFRAPGGLARDAAGNAYLADAGNSLIRKISATGAVTTLAGSSSNQGYRDATGTSAWFNTPADLAVDSQGVVYVADTGNSVIRRIAPDGTVTTFAGAAGQRGSADGAAGVARFNQPGGIVVDASGTLYVADTFNHTIRKISAGGAVSTYAGVPGVSGIDDGVGTAALFNQPGGLALDSAGKLYVADTGNNSIRVISTAGAVSTLAGLPTVAGLEDGVGTAALFNQPKDLSLDAAGNIYVADFGNAAIRVITAAGAVSTLNVTLTTTPAPTPPSNPTPAPSTGGSTPTASGSSGANSGGGGAVSPWFLLLLAGAAGLRRRVRK